MTNKEAIEHMLYHDGVDTSAWGKLYERELFDSVQYPLGKNYEDIGTTYALMLQCSEISVGNESKYNYVIRSSSIVNSDFNVKKFDLLEMTDKMAHDVIQIYPDLQDATLRRQVYARFSTLNQMLDTDDYPEERAEIIQYIKDNGQQVKTNPKTPKRDKIAISLLSMGYKVYRWTWKCYQRLMK